MQSKLLLKFGFVLLSIFWITSSQWGCSHKESSLVVTLVNESQIGGKRICWDETDQHGRLVGTGQYEVRITAGKFSDRLTLEIRNGVPKSDSPKCSPDTGRTSMPTTFSLSGFPDPYPPGDTIVVNYGIPVATKVLIEIYK